jgi:hypothetical protein
LSSMHDHELVRDKNCQNDEYLDNELGDLTHDAQTEIGEC